MAAVMMSQPALNDPFEPQWGNVAHGTSGAVVRRGMGSPDGFAADDATGGAREPGDNADGTVSGDVDGAVTDEPGDDADSAVSVTAGAAAAGAAAAGAAVGVSAAVATAVGVGELPVGLAVALRLHGAGYADDVIATALGIPVQSVPVTLRVARGKLAQLTSGAGA